MQIRFGTKILATGGKTSAAGPIRISTQGSVQVAPRIRSRNADAYDRLNYRTEISFGVDELFSELRAAENAIENRAEEIKNLGSQELIIVNTGDTAQKMLHDAKLIGCSSSYRGVTAHFEYTFSGTAITV
jgi:hypothetical protein